MCITTGRGELPASMTEAMDATEHPTILRQMPQHRMVQPKVSREEAEKRR